MNSHELQALLGAPADSQDVVRLLAALGVHRAIRLPRDETEAEVNLTDAGLRLEFEPAGAKTSRLRLSTVDFYGDEEGFTAFRGGLPADLSFSDDSAAVRKRLGKPTKSSKHAPYDIWEQDGFSLAVKFTPDKRRIRVVSLISRGGRPLESVDIAINGEQLPGLLGLRLAAPEVQDALARLARGVQPELDPEADEALVDWVLVNEIGLEFGFEDEAYVLALDPELRGEGPLLLTQLYFYGDTPDTRRFPGVLPFGLDFADDRDAVRRKLAAHESTRRSYVRDTWTLPRFEVAVDYGEADGRLESVFCHVRPTPWPALVGGRKRLAKFTPDALVGLFGRRWSNAELRERLAPLGYEDALKDVRREHTADFRREHGIELMFMPSDDLVAADHRYPAAYAFAGVAYYASRELDARAWVGPLPCGLTFTDTPGQLVARIGREPDERTEEPLSGVATWRFTAYTLSVVYSTVENRVLRVIMMAATTDADGS